MEKEDLQERLDELRGKLNALALFDVHGKPPFGELVRQIFIGTGDTVRQEARKLFPKSKTWQDAQYMKFTWKNWWKNRKKQLGLLIRD